MTEIKNVVSAVISVDYFPLKVLYVKTEKHKKWGFPAGHIEFGESLEAAVKRETKEETNLDIHPLIYLGFWEYISTDGNHIHNHSFEGKIIGNRIPKPKEGEIERIEAFTLEEALEIGKKGLLRAPQSNIEIYQTYTDLMNNSNNRPLYPLFRRDILHSSI
ncbi:MAG TPA: NUDIX hydrolase [Candidatus Nanoarchaeia archaeon]|nr:NUDIX hydrolase [Candidatus Nanoarchaeia archaeon]